MLRTPPDLRELLEHAGYVFDANIGAWIRRGEHPSPLTGRMLDADIAARLTREQITAWIKAGEGEDHGSEMAPTSVRPTPEELHAMMEAAGHLWNADLDGWTRPQDERTLDAEVASTMRREQIVAWLKAGET
jgi:hypothetical protein